MAALVSARRSATNRDSALGRLTAFGAQCGNSGRSPVDVASAGSGSTSDSSAMPDWAMIMQRRWHDSQMHDQLPPQRVEHVWTRDDRLAQLSDLESSCDRLATLFATHADPRAAELFEAKAALARRLAAEGFSQAKLNSLGGEFPEGAWWLNPKAADFDAPREKWQDEVALLHKHARAVAIDLRSIATLYPA